MAMMTYEPVYRATTIRGVVAEGIVRKRNNKEYILLHEPGKERPTGYVIDPSTKRHTGGYIMVGY